MRLRNRLLLIALGMVIFAIVTPALVLFARGYKYDFEENKIVKTGVLVVRTRPDQASVFLDDKLQPSTTPLNLRFLPPKDYLVRVEKDGYKPWSKRLPVKAEFVSWANLNREFLTLFFQKPETLN